MVCQLFFVKNFPRGETLRFFYAAIAKFYLFGSGGGVQEKI
jgi:hypothetical protein